MRLGGLRIDPKTNIGSRVTFYNDVKVRRIADNKTVSVRGLPQSPRLSNFAWSPDQTHMAMTHKTEQGIELGIDIASLAKKLMMAISTPTCVVQLLGLPTVSLTKKYQPTENR